MALIKGVVVDVLKVRVDERGRLMEIRRADEKNFECFGQVYMTTVYPGVVKGWHYHKKQSDCFACVSGMIKLVLYDQRKDSPTHGMVNEFFMGVHNPVRVIIPPYVMHGFKGVGVEEALIINVPTACYQYDSPDEYRIDPHDSTIPYQWQRRDY